jgi:Tol biopolymer transport system component
LTLTLLGASVFSAGCERTISPPTAETPASMRDVTAVRLNYRYEADVPAPALEPALRSDQDRNAGVQADFDASRTQELLDRTITSPDKKRVLAVYRNVADLPSEVRLDMYSSDGKLLRRVTADTMAAHFPDTIVWSPDSRSVAFVATNRTVGVTPLTAAPPNVLPPDDANANLSDANSTPAATPTPAAPTPAAPTGVLTFRTEQIYICDAEGAGLKALTQNEGLIYFYYVWSPDSSMLAALATTSREWRYQEIISDGKGELMVPQGRLRIIEKNSRERRLDDNTTSVRPVWSPDSAKVAVAYDTQVRVYDAAGTNPTQAAIPLKNQLLISSQAYDRDQQRKLQAANANADANAANTPPVPDQPSTTLPDEKLLVSYNPIVEVAWTADDIIYLKTAYLRRLKNEADSVTSFARWHRLILTPQAAVPAK